VLKNERGIAKFRAALNLFRVFRGQLEGQRSRNQTPTSALGGFCDTEFAKCANLAIISLKCVHLAGFVVFVHCRDISFWNTKSN
jgi:hypothetical protein